MAPTAYRIELASTGRAGCQNKFCKDQSIKIGKGEFRFGVWVEIPDRGASWRWRHWGCITPEVLKNVMSTTEGDMDFMDGYEDMPQEWQEKFLAAVKAGHVPDEDWRGDLEFNRPGQKGFKRRTPVKAAAHDGDEEREEPESPVKGKGKKRAKKDTEDDGPEVPAKKKTKKAANKDEDDAAAAPKKSSKKSAVTSEHDAGTAPQKKASKKASKKANDDGDDDDGPPVPAKKAKAKKVKTTDPTDEDAEGEAPKKRGRKPKKAA